MDNEYYLKCAYLREVEQLKSIQEQATKLANLPIIEVADYVALDSQFAELLKDVDNWPDELNDLAELAELAIFEIWEKLYTTN